jgi:hypothetical protein
MDDLENEVLDMIISRLCSGIKVGSISLYAPVVKWPVLATQLGYNKSFSKSLQNFLLNKSCVLPTCKKICQVKKEFISNNLA